MGEGNDVWEFPVLRVLEEEIKKETPLLHRHSSLR